MRFLIPIIVVLLVQGYIGWHMWTITPGNNILKGATALSAVVLFFMTFLAISPLKETLSLTPATLIYETATSWLIITLYLVIIFVLIDLGRICRLIPKAWVDSNPYTAIGIVALVSVVLIYGNLNYRNKHRETMEIATAKPLAHPLRIVMASDLHVGFHNQQKELHRWIDMINAEKPDMVLFAGDIIDGAIRPLHDFDAASEFRRLSAPAYACLGNHEYITGINESVKFYHDAGITLLRDSAIATSVGINIIGRDDRSNFKRLTIEQIKAKDHVNDSLFTILIDHQPYHLEQAQEASIDFQFSGHTHRGQIWPLSMLVDRMYECSFGPWKRGTTNYYISSGLGIWGGKYRIGTRSEFVVLTLKN